ncbi:MAG: hypothetical protein Q4F95_06545 [Oscillospiraceae bacterium]|nr:hypothetical protein [Oscillospiraceae bacterium]
MAGSIRKSFGRLISIFLALIIFCLFSEPLTAGAATGLQSNDNPDDAGHLIVSMVYDDSESMEGTKAMYCNYTFQMFLSLFSEKDELFITYMNKPRASANYSIRDNRQARVDNLRDHRQGVFTPITAVETAYNRLLNQQGGINDSYWLVVLTDGEFHDTAGKQLRDNYLDDYFRAYTNAEMPNGTKVNILYVGIGEGLTLPTESTDRNIHVYSAYTPEDILNILNASGEFFSDCLLADSFPSISYEIQNNVLQINTDVPLSKVIVVAHGNQSAQQDITGRDKNGNALVMDEYINAYYQNMNYSDGLKESLNGTVTYWKTVDDSAITDAMYISYDQDLDDSIKVYILPAIEVKILLYDENDNPVTAEECTESTVFTAEMVFNRIDTGEEISPDILTSNNETTIIVRDQPNNMYLMTGEGSRLSDISMVNEGIVIQGTTVFNESYSMYASKSISIYKSKPASESVYTYSRTGLPLNSRKVRLSLSKNNVDLTRREAVKITVRTDTSEFPALFMADYTVDLDGIVQMKPKFGTSDIFGRIFLSWLTVWTMPLGDVPFTITMKDTGTGATLVDTVNLKIVKGPMALEILYYVYPFIIIFLVLGFIFKRRFYGNMYISCKPVEVTGRYFIPDNKSRVTYRLVNKLPAGFHLFTGLSSFIPFASNAKKCGTVTIKAAGFRWKKSGYVLLKNKGGCGVNRNFRKADYGDEKFILNDINFSHEHTVKLYPNQSVLIKNESGVYMYKLIRGRIHR